ncbi:hypothetical protein ABZS83_28715 [Streptomyces sp. NPDC005426]|uniref:hypothetical protein n=1 Tax=Streptomyces sp. NPDC005426 TaxID=3155344 RepID=UPI0033A49103
MSKNEAVTPSGIPVFTGNLALLDGSVSALAKAGGSIATAAGDVHSSFGGLQAFYKAPEADQLFATTKPVADRGTSLKSDLETITGALRTYSDDACPLVEKLKELKREADAFVVQIRDDDKWREDGDLVDENNHRHDEIIETWTAFQAVERACHDKIVALVGGAALKIDDGSGKKGTYGYDAETLKHAEGLPWGDPVEESKPWYHLHEHAWDFVKGFFVDGVWGTIKGLGTLVGTDGWDSAKQAWSGLGKLATGLTISMLPMGNLLWAVPEDKLPSYLRDSRRAMKETGKALLAWDQWAENPSRAAGAVTFNVITTVFTGGTGGAASGAGKAALAAKALSTAGKVGRFVDPMTYVFKGAGMGLTKIGDVMAGFKGLGTFEVPALPEGVVTLPEGGFKLADGTLHLPEGSAIPDTAFQVPSNSFKLPDGAQIPAGAIDLGDGVVRLPEGMTPPTGSLRIPEGALKLPEGTTALPRSATQLTDLDGSTVYVDGPGNLLKEDGALAQHHSAAKREGLDTGTETPATLPPAQHPVLVGAHTVGGNADGTLRMGNDLGGVGRSGDDVTDLGRTPGGAANNLPGGSAGHHMPSNSLDGGGPGGGHHPTNNHDGGGPGGSHAEPAGSGGRDVSGGSAADNGIPGNAADNRLSGPRTPDASDLGGAFRGGEDGAPPTGTTRQPVPRPSFMLDGPDPYGRPGSLSLEQIEEIQVYRANEEPGYFEHHYRKDGTRKDTDLHDASGFTPPQLTQLVDDGPWVRAKDAPAPPKPHFLDADYVPVRAETVTNRARLRILDAAARKRYFAIQWDNLAEKWKSAADSLNTSHPDSTSSQLLDEATDAYKKSHTEMSRAAEEFGEAAAEHHFIAERYPDFERQELGGPKNGNDQFDQFWKHEDGRIVVIEAKSSTGTELGRRTLPDGTKVSQGSQEYFLDIVRHMKKRGEFEAAEAVERAMIDDKLDYVVVKGERNTGTYTGYRYRRFDISKGTLP